MFVLNDLVVVQSNADNQGADESRICENRVGPRNPFAIDLRRCQVSSFSRSESHGAWERTATTASPSLYRGAMAAQR